ncbi:MAG: metal-dependent hydrolase [Flavobacterium sp. BFFFF1]|nr:MAG: metal-dependent hydrolase [Flavobacterium sp. BFFFF1]
MEKTLQFGSKQLVYKLQFSKRKSLGITVHPDTGISIKAPLDTPIENVEEKIKKRALWIIKQQSYFLRFLPNPVQQQFVSGESLYYLGRQLRLEVIESSKEEVQYKGRFLQVNAKKKSKAKVLLEDWYREKAKVKFVEIANPLIEKFKKLGAVPSGIYVQEMATRWGSCTPKGKIILNPKLVRAPRRCIEYVIIHELCHLVHHNHAKAFFELQDAMCPDWEKRKSKLEEFS